jgi:UDP-glucose:(heptosyl)LPS alpha-1,3-glucosyltransferase
MLSKPAKKYKLWFLVKNFIILDLEMKLAFCIFNFYPYGGLGRDFIRIATLCQQRGHCIDVFTMRWQGIIPKNLNVVLVPTKGFTNHARCKSYVTNLSKTIALKSYDAIIGFNRMPGLDIYYVCDVCYALSRKNRSFWQRLSPRYRTYASFERAVFDTKSTTQIIYKAEGLKRQYVEYYHTPENRFHLVNPGIDPSRKIPQNAAQIRNQVRNEYNIKPEQQLILLIGTNFGLKGVDRALAAIASLPEQTRNNCSFWIIGQGKKNKFINLARRLHILKLVKFWGTTEKVSELLLAGDLLIHPARYDATGSVILEALAAGLPVLTTEVCGFASHVTKSNAGLVVPFPFKQKILNQDLVTMLDSIHQKEFKKNAIIYGKNEFLYDNEDIVNVIEQIAAKNAKPH